MVSKLKIIGGKFLFAIKKLWVFFILLIVLVAGTNAWLYPTINSLNENNQSIQLQSAFWAKNLIENTANHQVSVISDLALAVELWPESKDIFFDKFFLENKNYEGLKFINGNGRIIDHYDNRIKSTEHTEHHEWPNFFSTALFREVSRGNIYKGPIFFKNSVPFIEIAVPVYSQGNFNGILSAETNLKFAWEVVSQIKTRGNGKVYLVDMMGNLLADPNPENVLIGIPVLYRGVVAEIIKGDKEKIVGRYLNENKEEVQATAVFIPQFNWGVIVEESVSEIFSARNNIIFLAAAIFIAEFLLIILLVRNTFSLLKTTADLEKSKLALEEVKSALEATVDVRTKELRDLTENLGQQVDARTKDLRERIKELEKFHRLTIDRELRMRELKKEINELKKKIAPNYAENY